MRCEVGTQITGGLKDTGTGLMRGFANLFRDRSLVYFLRRMLLKRLRKEDGRSALPLLLAALLRRVPLRVDATVDGAGEADLPAALPRSGVGAKCTVPFDDPTWRMPTPVRAGPFGVRSGTDARVE